MAPRTIIITGASDGIGAAAARRLAADGHRLILVGRSPEKTAAVARETGADALTADFATLADVRRVAAEITSRVERIDVLMNNAGGIFGPQTTTVDGHEKTFQVNYLAPFLLTDLLLDRLRAGEGIVANTSSSAAKLLAKFDIDDLETSRNYTPNAAYGNAKLANILFTRALHAHYGGTGIAAVAIDPGTIRTNFGHDTTSIVRFVYRTPLSRLMLVSPDEGGARLVFFAEGTPGTDWTPGGFYTLTKPATEKETNPLVHDDSLVEKLWTRTTQLLASA
jgi:NAD(P)-dependent dehydrogenase (short-subunit alcohol dehydrogenase family)